MGNQVKVTANDMAEIAGKVVQDLKQDPSTKPTTDQNGQDSKKSDNKGNGTKPKKPKNNVAGKVATSVISHVVTNPKFWKLMGKLGSNLIKVVNHHSWWGGSSNAFTGATGPYINRTQYGMDAVVNITHFSCHPEYLIDTNLAKAKLQSALNAYDKQLGFQSYLTTTDIEKYIKASIVYTSVFASIKRMMNYTNVPIVQNIKYGEHITWQTPYGTKESGGYLLGFYGTFGVGEGSSFTDMDNMRLPTITNYVWDHTYVDTVTTCLLLPQHMELISYLFDNVFVNGADRGVNSFIEFDPYKKTIKDKLGLNPNEETYNAVAGNYYKEQLDLARDEFLEAQGANPYVESFLRYIGFKQCATPEWCQRDRISQAISVAEDADLIIALTNSQNEEYATNGKLINYSYDIDPEFTDPFQSETIGKLGSMLKLNYMATKPSTYSSLVVYKYAAAASSLKWNKYPNSSSWVDLTSETTRPDPAFVVSRPIYGIMGTNTMSASYLFNLVDAFTCVVDIAEFAGIDSFDQSPNALTFGPSPAYGVYLTNITSKQYALSVVGSDVLKLSQENMEEIRAINKLNFTLGEDYLKRFNDYIESVTSMLTIR